MKKRLAAFAAGLEVEAFLHHGCRFEDFGFERVLFAPGHGFVRMRSIGVRG